MDNTPSLSHQDGGPGGEGTVTIIGSNGRVEVSWENGHTSIYRMGLRNRYDLSLAPSELENEKSESENSIISVCVTRRPNRGAIFNSDYFLDYTIMTYAHDSDTT